MFGKHAEYTQSCSIGVESIMTHQTPLGYHDRLNLAKRFQQNTFSNQQELGINDSRLVNKLNEVPR